MTISNDLPRSVGAQFEAKWDSNCKGCGLAIYEGDLMGYVDNVAVCDGCYNDADAENSIFVRDMALAQREADRAADPERFARLEAAAKGFTDSIKARMAERRATEVVCASCHLVQPCDCEPQEEAPAAIEPGIQALMAAGLLQGQEPGGSGVCPVEITAADGKVTEVNVPVPVDPAKAPRKRASRAKPKPEAPSENSAEGVLAGPVRLESVSLVKAGTGETGSVMLDAGIDDPNAARAAELAANAETWDPAAIAAEVKVDALQAGLQAAVDAGTMTPEQAAALGWVNPLQIRVALEPIQYPPGLPEAVGDAVVAGTINAMTARTVEPLEEFKADPSTTAADLFLDALAGARSVAEEDAILAALDDLPAYQGGGNHDTIKGEILGVIIDAINYHPRSLQKRIGPSEIGTECDHCLAAKLAGWEQVNRGEAWLPTVGTAVHSWIEGAFARHALGPSGTRRFLTERRVAVGEIDGVEITGSCDLVDVVSGWTWDWKVVGPTTLKSAKAGPSRRYVVQQHLYARGWNRLGVKVTHVGIAYLPRNAMSVKQGVWWSAEYDESIALAALERADRLAKNIRALQGIGDRSAGEDHLTDWIKSLPRWREWREDGINTRFEGNSTNEEHRIVCMDCPRYADYPADPAAALKQLDGLMA